MTGEPVFRHVDDAEVRRQKVKAQRNADGSEDAASGPIIAGRLHDRQRTCSP